VKPVSPASTYVAIIPRLTEAAREVGYAVAVHGSLGRDLDLVAIPWVEEAVSAEKLILCLLAAVGYNARLSHRQEGKDPTQGNGDIPGKKPHGRLSWSIHFDNGLYVDVSVMPLMPASRATS
jgi:hypothetical protein